MGIQLLVALSEGGQLGTAALDEPAARASSGPSNEGSFRERVERLERSLLTEALSAAAGNQSQAARQLGLSRVTFLDKLKRYGLG